MSRTYENTHTYQTFSHIKYFRNKSKKFYQNILMEIKNDIEALDLKIKNSAERKQAGYLIKGYVPRTIITIFGKLTFVRTKYVYYDKKSQKNKTVFLLDKYFKIEPYKKIDLNLRVSIIKELIKGKKQQEIVDQFKSANITRVSVSNLAKSINNVSLNKTAQQDYKIPNNSKDKKYIYLNIDDTFTPLRDYDKSRKLFRIRLAVAHLGYSNNIFKKELLEKRAFYLIDKVPLEKNNPEKLKQYVADIYQQLVFFYGDISDKKIIVCGDGAKWIKNLATLLDAEYVLDKYHITNLLFKIFHHKKNNLALIKNLIKLESNNTSKLFYNECVKLLNLGNPEKIIAKLMVIKKEGKWKKKEAKINQLITYIQNNKEGITSYKKDYYIGSQTEAMVSHIVQSLQGYGAKIFSLTTFTNLLNLRIAWINKLDPIKAYYKSSLNLLKNY